MDNNPFRQEQEIAVRDEMVVDYERRLKQGIIQPRKGLK